jgi:uncharacterized repeat protein (TIGR03803 family)
MKKLLLLLCLITPYVHAQNIQLWGTTFSGGAKGGGTIYKINDDASGFQTRYSLATPESPKGNLLQANDGLLYGTSGIGGANGTGFIFTYNTASSTYVDVFDFTHSDGMYANGSLIQATDGKLYGMTNEGGAYNDGVLYSFNPTGNVYTKLHDFYLPDGYFPYGGLVQATNGKLYGLTSGGGAYGSGVLFSYDISLSTYTDEYDFQQTDGEYAQGSLLQAADGKLYGLTLYGGINSSGNIFSYDIAQDTLYDLYDFGGSDGYYPLGSLIQASNGLLYGMTEYGGTNGNIFSYDIAGNVLTTVYFFNGTDGNSPQGSLLQAADGKLYGMTNTGGLNDKGVLFRYDISLSAYQVLYNYNGAEGKNPLADVIQASDGHLYGFANNGGAGNVGAMFSYNISTTAYSDLHDFATSNGAYPENNYIQANDGNFYGTTSTSGDYNQGTLFKFNPISNTYNALYHFSEADGNFPFGEPVQASDGKLYGLTNSGGTDNYGVIYRYDIASGIYSVLHNFNGADGQSPWVSNLLEVGSGKLYGMTHYGGANNYGVLFSYDIGSNTYSVLHDFDQATGQGPHAGLMRATDGLLYGTCGHGGAHNHGVIFSFNTTGSTYTDLYDFDNADGADPRSTLTQANNGSLYGMGLLGGANGDGVIFRYNPVSHIYTDVHDFTGSDGSLPLRSLLKSSDGMLYGTTDNGGTTDEGVLFRFNPSDNSYLKYMDFDYANGRFPMDLIELDTTLLTIAAIRELNGGLAVYPNPSHGSFTIPLDGQLNGMLKIYNVMGEEVYSFQMNLLPQGNTSYTLNQNLPAGIYLVEVVDSMGLRGVTQKLIVQ